MKSSSSVKIDGSDDVHLCTPEYNPPHGKLLQDENGTVRPYTRHGKGCTRAADDNGCRCPKWLYVFNARTRKKTRYSLNTPSWADALDRASKTFKGLDPEIAKARAAEVKQERQRITVAPACDLWIERTIRERPDTNTVPSCRSIMGKLTQWATEHGITHIQDITTGKLERWYSSKAWKSRSMTTRSQQWGVLRSMFAFLVERKVLDESPIAPIKAVRPPNDHVQGPYTDDQVRRILAAVEQTTPVNIDVAEREVYAVRLRTFINLLVHTGMDLIDATLYQQERLRKIDLDGREVYVYSYKRQKTRVQAVVPIKDAIADDLINVPTLKENPAGMPFRADGDLRSEIHNWSRRIQRVLDVAGVQWVTLPNDDRGRPRKRRANAKQFRHTFAVRMLKVSQRPEEVGKMLGHVDSTMVIRRYAPWVEELEKEHVRRVIGSW